MVDDDDVLQADGEGVQAEAGGPETGVRGGHLPPPGGIITGFTAARKVVCIRLVTVLLWTLLSSLLGCFVNRGTMFSSPLPPAGLHRPADRGQEGDQPEVREPDGGAAECREEEQGEPEGHGEQARHGDGQDQTGLRVVM